MGTAAAAALPPHFQPFGEKRGARVPADRGLHRLGDRILGRSPKAIKDTSRPPKHTPLALRCFESKFANHSGLDNLEQVMERTKCK